MVCRYASAFMAVEIELLAPAVLIPELLQRLNIFG